MNKVVCCQIVKPINDFELYYTVLNRLQSKCHSLANKAIQLAWEWQGFSSDYKAQHDNYPKTKDILGYTNIFGYTYDALKDKFCDIMHSNNYGAALKQTLDKWNTDLADIMHGDKSVPSFKKDQPIDLASRSIHVYKDGSNYLLDLNLISKSYKKQLGRKTTAFTVLIKVADKSQQAIIDRIISGEYKLTASKLIKHKNKWFINLGYSFEPEKHEVNPSNVMGVDMGIVYPVYMAFNNSLSRYKINGGEIDEFRRRVENRRKQILEQRKYCGNGSIGHGVHTRIKPIEVLSDKVSNFRDTCNHRYSRYVVDMALKHQCGVIQMEDLSGISKDDIFLKNWSYYDLQQKIEYKAKEYGIEVRYINPRYTSQRCSKCGHIHKDNRKTQADFECQVCGFKTEADFNAAKNIATLDIDRIIDEQMSAT